MPAVYAFFSAGKERLKFSAFPTVAKIFQVVKVPDLLIVLIVFV